MTNKEIYLLQKSEYIGKSDEESTQKLEEIEDIIKRLEKDESSQQEKMIDENSEEYIKFYKLRKLKKSAEKASIIGDTVGDPMKDTSGPSLNILIKLSSIISVVFGALFVKTSYLIQ